MFTEAVESIESPLRAAGPDSSRLLLPLSSPRDLSRCKSDIANALAERLCLTDRGMVLVDEIIKETWSRIHKGGGPLSSHSHGIAPVCIADSNVNLLGDARNLPAMTWLCLLDPWNSKAWSQTRVAYPSPLSVIFSRILATCTHPACKDWTKGSNRISNRLGGNRIGWMMERGKFNRSMDEPSIEKVCRRRNLCSVRSPDQLKFTWSLLATRLGGSR